MRPPPSILLRLLNPVKLLSLRRALALGPLAFTLVGLLGPLLELFMSMDKNYDRLMMPFEDDRDLFDFIIGEFYK
jgi:hypothetical protein